jgi:hypothetical protein
MFSGIIEHLKRIWERAPFGDSIDAWQTAIPVDIGVIIYWIILLCGLLAISIWLLSNKKTSRLLDSISNNLLVVSSVIWLLGVIIYIVGFYREELNWLSVIPRAIISSFKMFVVTNELARVEPQLHGDAVYMSIFSLVHFTAAFITFLFIFKMVGYKIKSSLRLIFYKWFHSKGKVVHLFWGVNEASVLLAEDIRKQHATETIIFVDIDKENDDNTQRKATLSHITNTITIKNSEIARLDAIDAFVDHCYNGPTALKGDNETDIFGNLHLKTIGAIVRKCSKAYFYFLSNDEAQNIAGALNLQKDRRLRSMNENKPVIYIHARRDANNEVFDHYSQYDGASQRMKIKIVDSAYLSVATLKQDERTLPVNCVKIDQSTGLVDSPFTALIVGFGGTGQEAFKFLYEYSAFIGSDMKKSPFKCYAVDGEMNMIAGLIREKMPAIKEDELSLIQATVDSEEFWDKVRTIIKELNYVVIALNNDTIGLSLAVNLFKYALRNRPANQPMLKILVRCYDNGNEKRMTEVTSSLSKSIEGKNVEIRLFGQEKKLYRCNTILSDDTLQEAMEFNKVYEKSELSAEEQWQKNFGEGEILRLMTTKKMSRYHAIYDINRRIAQNISNSLHSRTKMILMGFGENEQSERLNLYYGYANFRKDETTKYECGTDEEQLLLNIAMVEHERWIASHKLMGYTYNPENDCVQKHHKCICPWNELDEMTQSYDCNVVDTTIMMAFNKRK